MTSVSNDTASYGICDSGKTVIATFVYDGDGKRVKSVMDGETILFAGAHYEMNLTSGAITKYYFAGASRIAMRKYTIPVSMEVEYMIGDHLGSTSLTTDSNGNKISEIRYKPWGETRYSWTDPTLATTPAYAMTKYQYTGQFSYEAEFGLYFYNARWYDSLTGRFAQADVFVPGMANSQAWDRYAYTLNNPLNHTDPSGRSPCNDDGYCGDFSDPDYQISIYAEAITNGFGWTLQGNLSLLELKKIFKAGYDVGLASTSVLGGSLVDGIRHVFPQGITIEKSTQSCGEAHPGTGWTCWGEVTNGNKLTIYSNSNANSSSYNNFLVHEMGHVFDNTIGSSTGTSLTGYYQQRLDYITTEGWTDMPTGNVGYGCYVSLENLCLWIQGYHTNNVADIEQTADMFLGWVYNTWDTADMRRGNWMALWMPSLLNGTVPSYIEQFNCDEFTGDGC